MSDEALLLAGAWYYPPTNPKRAETISVLTESVTHLVSTLNPKMPNKQNMQLVVAKPQRKVPEALKKYVQAQLSNSLESRWYDESGAFALSSAAVGPSPTMSLVPAVDRDGEVVHYTHQRFSFTIGLDVTAPRAVRVRVLIFDWFPLSVPTVQDVLEDVTATNIVQSAHRFTTKQFYRMVQDHVFCLAPGAGQTSVHKLCDMKNKRKVRFNDGVAPPAAMGLRYWAVCTDTPGTSFPTFAYYSRLEFTDA